jgi:hypothetical protein
VGEDAAEYPDWYPAVVTDCYHTRGERDAERSYHILYDSGESVRVVASAIRARESAAVRPPSKQMLLRGVRSPVRPMSEALAAWALWSDRDSVAARLVEHVEAISRRSLRPWQRVVDDSGRPYWWHLTTRACQEERPEDWESRVDLPLAKAVVAMRELLDANREKANRVTDAHRLLRELRAHLMNVPVVAKLAAHVAGGAAEEEGAYDVPEPAQVSFLLYTVTFYANLAHSLTRSPEHL